MALNKLRSKRLESFDDSQQKKQNQYTFRVVQKSLHHFSNVKSSFFATAIRLVNSCKKFTHKLIFSYWRIHFRPDRFLSASKIAFQLQVETDNVMEKLALHLKSLHWCYSLNAIQHFYLSHFLPLALLFISSFALVSFFVQLLLL